MKKQILQTQRKYNYKKWDMYPDHEKILASQNLDTVKLNWEIQSLVLFKCLP